MNKDGIIVVEVYINDNKELFDSLYSNKDEIEKKLGLELIWDRLNGKKAARIKHAIPGLNFDDHSNYDCICLREEQLYLLENDMSACWRRA